MLQACTKRHSATHILTTDIYSNLFNYLPPPTSIYIFSLYDSQHGFCWNCRNHLLLFSWRKLKQVKKIEYIWPLYSFIISSLHWPILHLFHVLFVQWSITVKPKDLFRYSYMSPNSPYEKTSLLKRDNTSTNFHHTTTKKFISKQN